ncbi:hypothetical protein CCM_02322 [Cordyceps militaris CM01]|uniref:Uncharacterized protein n=1 Tax=Cordyceps militaris (strain CM01) TaxID=983644 RepID=G3J919_CORMM|nr:uncharacterized protein CCM_02322 [Cordyceps militaris CM01]EGX94051.1 hypothetical protein CCM_02322 [Cordyceps militaris CM01]
MLQFSYNQPATYLTRHERQRNVHLTEQNRTTFSHYPSQLSLFGCQRWLVGNRAAADGRISTDNFEAIFKGDGQSVQGGADNAVDLSHMECLVSTKASFCSEIAASVCNLDFVWGKYTRLIWRIFVTFNWLSETAPGQNLGEDDKKLRRHSASPGPEVWVKNMSGYVGLDALEHIIDLLQVGAPGVGRGQPENAKGSLDNLLLTCNWSDDTAQGRNHSTNPRASSKKRGQVVAFDQINQVNSAVL